MTPRFLTRLYNSKSVRNEIYSSFPSTKKVIDQESVRPNIDPKTPYSVVSCKEIRLTKSKKELIVTFTDKIYRFCAEFLRVHSPSAEVQGYTEKKLLVYGKRDVLISEVEPVGNYAIRISFNDRHDSGVFSWKYLNDLGKSKYTLSKLYIKDLRVAGKSRDLRKI